MLVRPHAGLCNRLRTLTSSLILARELDMQLRLHWVPGDGCWCLFGDLFENHPEIECTSFAGSALPPRLGKEIDWLARQLPKKLHGAALAARHDVAKPYRILTRTDIEAGDYVLDPTAMNGHSLILFRNVMPFRPKGWTTERYEEAVSEFLRSLKPTPAIQEKLFDLPHGTIGVHARRGDHQRSSAISTDHHFLRAIETRLNERPQARLYVASDDLSFVETIRRRYPERILDRGAINRSRHDHIGMQDALADLIMLSRCAEILGSAISSYSEYAAAFHRIPLYKVGTA